MKLSTIINSIKVLVSEKHANKVAFERRQAILNEFRSDLQEQILDSEYDAWLESECNRLQELCFDIFQDAWLDHLDLLAYQESLRPEPLESSDYNYCPDCDVAGIVDEENGDIYCPHCGQVISSLVKARIYDEPMFSMNYDELVDNDIIDIGSGCATDKESYIAEDYGW